MIIIVVHVYENRLRFIEPFAIESHLTYCWLTGSHAGLEILIVVFANLSHFTSYLYLKCRNFWQFRTMSQSATSAARSKQQQQLQQQEEQQDMLNQQRLIEQMQKSVFSQSVMKKANEQTFSFEYLGIPSISRGKIIEIFTKIRCIIIMGPESRAKIATQCVEKLNICKQYQKIGNSEI